VDIATQIDIEQNKSHQCPERYPHMYLRIPDQFDQCDKNTHQKNLHHIPRFDMGKQDEKLLDPMLVSLELQKHKKQQMDPYDHQGKNKNKKNTQQPHYIKTILKQ
jgi:hypothetical protein